MEAAERGEGKKGREIIRVVPGEQSEDGIASTGGESGMCKLLLQDSKGVKAFGIELKRVKDLKVGMNIGTKVPSLFLRRIT